MRRIFRCRKHLFLGLFLACCFAPAWAFPAPDLIINLFGSGAQLVGIMAASLGAACFGYAKHGRPRNTSPVHRWLLVSLAILLLGSLAGNVWQYWDATEQQARRLQTGLWRPSAPTHPILARLGIKREEFNRWLEQGVAYNLIDVREPEELELGFIPGAIHSRYADLLTRDIGKLRHDIPNVLVCDSGFRSGEICAQLVAKGWPCRYVEGGYAKWTAEERPMSGVTTGSGPGLQALPSYPKENVLLDTPEVSRLVQQEGARFIDVRPPAEFESAHLADAINLPVREQPSSQLNPALAQLPHVPLIAVCDDNRSCFYSKVIGLRLSRLGADYRGRYTVAQEYPIPGKLSGSLVLRRFSTWFEQGAAMLTAPPKALLQSVENHFGSLLFAIILLALLVRVLLLPQALLAERQRLRLLAVQIRRAEFQQRYEGDPGGASRAWRYLLRQQGIRPGHNFLFAVLQLILLVGCVHAVHDMAQQFGGTESPYAAWADPAPWHGLSIFLTLTSAIVLYRSFRSASRWRWLWIAVPATVLGIATDRLSAAVDTYLLCSLLLLWMQQWFLERGTNGRGRFVIPRRSPGIVPLVEAAMLPQAGVKALSLARLLRAGLPVPDGFVLDIDAIFNEAALRSALRRLRFFGFGWRNMQLAVRSSMMSEDQTGRSQAGRYVSVLQVTIARLSDAIARVARDNATRNHECKEGKDPTHGGSIIVQAMVQAEYAGVLFTEHPECSGTMLLEWAPGIGAVVSGRDNPCALRIGRVSGAMLDAVPSHLPSFTPLWQLAHQVESFFDSPQDIEWAYCNGRFYLLQARPITRRIVEGASHRAQREAERSRLLKLVCHNPANPANPAQHCLLLDEAAAALPQASPLSLSLLNLVHGPGGAVDLAWRRLSLDYLAGVVPCWTTVFGQTRLISPACKQTYLKPGIMMQLRFSRKADALANTFEHEFLPLFRQAMRWRQALDLSQLRTEDLFVLLHAWHREFVTEQYVEAEVLNLAAKLYADTAAGLLERSMQDPALYLRAERMTPDVALIRALIDMRDGKMTPAAFFDQFGHRAAHDFELSEPRYAERNDWMVRWQTSLPTVLPPVLPLPTIAAGRLTQAAVRRAQRFITLKEEAKHECARALACMRKLLLELEKRHVLTHSIFSYRFDQLHDDFPALENAVNIDPVDSQTAFESIDVPGAISLLALESLDLSDKNNKLAGATGGLRGIHVSGSQTVFGHVCILRDPTADNRFPHGAILVVPTADPAWIALFPMAVGVICETGGMLCHAAIMAREFGLNAVFGVAGATTSLQDGDYVELGAEGGIQISNKF